MLNPQVHKPNGVEPNVWLHSQSLLNNSALMDNYGEAQGSLNSILSNFHAHQLADLDKANLMDRVDVKFMLPMTALPVLLTQLQSHYSVLEIKGKRVSKYYNQYFDTKGMDFYQEHHNGKLNRFKVRQRTYVDTDTTFLEVKFKNNKKRTIKTRVNCPQDAKSDDSCHQFIYQEMDTSFNDLEISQQSGYNRIALANEASAERLTLDFNLWYQRGNNDPKVTPAGFFIAELKQYKRSKLSPFFQLMSKNNIFPASFSKYCIGCALLYKNTIKTNQFKSVLAQVQRYSLANDRLNNRPIASSKSHTNPTTLSN